MKKIKIKFPKSIKIMHIPFMGGIGAYDQLYKEIDRIEYPKGVRYIRAVHEVFIDLKDSRLNRSSSEVELTKAR